MPIRNEGYKIIGFLSLQSRIVLQVVSQILITDALFEKPGQGSYQCARSNETEIDPPKGFDIV